MKMFISGSLIFILSFALSSFLIADRFLNQIRKEEFIHRKEIAKDWSKFEKKSSGKAMIPIFTGTLNKNVKDFSCSNIEDFPKETDHSSTLEEKLAYPWTDLYVKKFKQPLSPFTFSQNAFSFYCHGHKKSPRWRIEFIEQLLSRLKEYLVIEKKGTFFEYRFPFKPLDYQMPVPWRSAFAQGTILAGLVHLQEKSPSKEITFLMDQIFNALVPKSRNYEVSFKDKRGYRWFDEYPLPGSDVTSYILNGHIGVIIGVYYYWNHTANIEAERLLRESIETVRDHLIFFRYVGRVNCYDLRTCELDYAFQRAFIQMGSLSELTSHPSFEITGYLLKRDYEAMLKYREALNFCKKNVANKILCAWFPLDILKVH